MGRHREFDEAEVLAAAMDVFWRSGFTGAGMQELCDAMKLNPGSLYAAFGSKKDLFSKVIRHYLTVVTRDGVDVINAAPSGHAGIRGYFKYIVDEIMTGRRKHGCFGTNSFMELGEQDTMVHDVMTAHFLLLEDAFRGALKRDGAVDASDRARYLVCVAQGLNVLARTSPERASLEAIVDTAVAPVRAKEAA